MQVTLYRHKKGELRMCSRDIGYIAGLLKEEKGAEEALFARQKLNMAFLARTTDLTGKLPVLVFAATYKKHDGKRLLRRYNGYVLLEVNALGSLAEAEAVRGEADFIGFCRVKRAFGQNRGSFYSSGWNFA